MVVGVLITINKETSEYTVHSQLNEIASLSIMERYLEEFAPYQAHELNVHDANDYAVQLIWDMQTDCISCSHNCGDQEIRDFIIRHVVYQKRYNGDLV